MKTIYLFLCLFFLSVSGLATTLAWDPNSEPNVRYRVYRHLTPGWAIVGETSETYFTLPALTVGKHTFVVTAFDDWSESAHSDTLTGEVRFLKSPVGIRVTLTVARAK